MTSYESHLFNELLDVNYEIKTGNHNSIIKMALITRYSQLVASLEDSLGEAAWKAFVSTGKKMFSAN